MMKSTRDIEPFTTGQQFYIYHHVNVLGIKKGCWQVARRLGVSVEEIEVEYYALHKKQRTHQTAI